MSERCVVLGGGGHAAVVIDALRAAGAVEPVAILDPDESVWSMRVLGVPVIGGDDGVLNVTRPRKKSREKAVAGIDNVA